MKRVTGLGGIFFKSENPEALSTWYRDRLGIMPDDCGGVAFRWREHLAPDQEGCTVWAPFPRDTDYFGSTRAPFMINYRVEDLAALLALLRAEGVEVEEGIEESAHGRFGWIVDPEGNRIELWEPPQMAGKRAAAAV